MRAFYNTTYLISGTILQQKLIISRCFRDNKRSEKRGEGITYIPSLASQRLNAAHAANDHNGEGGCEMYIERFKLGLIYQSV